MCVHSLRGSRRLGVSADWAVFQADPLPAPPADPKALAGDLRVLIFKWVCSSRPCMVPRCAGHRPPVASAPEYVLLLPRSLFFFGGASSPHTRCFNRQVVGKNAGVGCPFVLHHILNCIGQFSAVYTFFSSVQFSRSVVSDSLRPHESQHARPPCPSPTPRVHSNSRPSSQ